MPRVNGVMTLTDGERSGNDICSQQALAGVNVSASLFDTMLSDIATEITNSVASDGSTVLQGNLDFGGNKATNLGAGTGGDDAVTLSQVQSLLNTLIPAGTIVPTANQNTATPPSGWLFCNGQTLSTSTYATLYSAIGTKYGTGGAGTFKVPDLRQRFILGKADSGTGANMGDSGGSIDHTHDMANHTHTMAHTHDMANHTHTMAHTHTAGDLTALIGFSTADSQLGAIRNGSITFGASGATYYSTHDILTGGTGYSLGATTPIVPGTPVAGTTDGASNGTTSTPSSNTTGSASSSTTSTPSSNTTSSANPPYLVANYIIKF